MYVFNGLLLIKIAMLDSKKIEIEQNEVAPRLNRFVGVKLTFLL
jgi:hypothetical protein